MRKKLVLISGLGICFLQKSIAWAVETTAGATTSAAGNISVGFFTDSIRSVCLVLGIAAGMCGIAMGIAIANAMNAIARQPEAAPKIQLNMMIGLAFIESLVLYSLFLGIVILFANPFVKYIVK
ncbi:MAG: F0F1 ATP synthase subunit C [Candidatus Omnitrophica bacterium]|nr:F0F1 ATP synthase subunit C [Candidatus Omnitrophota bacterium]